MHKTVVCLEKYPGIVTSFQSFEFTNVLLKHSSSCLRLVIVYRPQTMADGTSSTAKFFEEFAVDVFDPVISDHYLVRCCLALPKKTFERRKVNYSKLKFIDLQELRDDTLIHL